MGLSIYQHGNSISRGECRAECFDRRVANQQTKPAARLDFATLHFQLCPFRYRNCWQIPDPLAPKLDVLNDYSLGPNRNTLLAFTLDHYLAFQSLRIGRDSNGAVYYHTALINPRPQFERAVLPDIGNQFAQVPAAAKHDWAGW